LIDEAVFTHLTYKQTLLMENVFAILVREGLEFIFVAKRFCRGKEIRNQFSVNW